MDYRELSRIAGDPAAVRGTAAYVRSLLGPDITDWQLDFLTKLEKFSGEERLSTRQAETLISLRERVTRRATVAGYSAARLVRQLHEMRLDLSEEDEEFVARLHAIGPGLALSTGEWKGVLGLCRRLGLIDDPFIPLH